MFWIISAALVVIVAAAIIAPIWRARDAGAAQPAAAYDLRVYRDQLREVDRDLERGVIGADDAARLRTEIGRKVLDADRRLAGSAASVRGGAITGAGAVLALLLVGAAALYWHEGTPGLGDRPIALRLAEAQAHYDNRPSQSQAEAQAPARTPIDLPEDYAELVQQLRDAVAQNPDDVQGLTLLATHEMRSGNLAAARDAQARLVAIKGDQASAGDLMRLAGMMTEAAGGTITPEAEQVLARAVQADPSQPQARYMMGMLQWQNGRPDRAFPIWRALIEEGPDDAPWNVSIRAAMPDLAWLAGHPTYTPPEPRAALPGPDAEAMAAAQDMTPAERQQMVEGMVAGLEARLAEQGGTPDEWARLISSLVVIGKRDHAAAVWEEARARFAASPPALQTVTQAAEDAGLTR